MKDSSKRQIILPEMQASSASRLEYDMGRNDECENPIAEQHFSKVTYRDIPGRLNEDVPKDCETSKYENRPPGDSDNDDQGNIFQTLDYKGKITTVRCGQRSQMQHNILQPDRPFSCGLCDARFKRRRNLVEHIQGKHERREFRCPCGRIYNWRSPYINHMDKCSVALAQRK